MDPLLIILVLASAAVSALNPYTIGVLIMLISLVLGKGHPTKRMVWLGATFVSALFLTSLLLGSVLLTLLSMVEAIPAVFLSIGIALFIVVAGILEIKDYFWYGQHLSLRIPKRATEHIRKMSKKTFGFVGAALLGAFVAIAALPTTSAAYLATITILKNRFDPTALELLTLYNFVFILPMIILIVMVAAGVKISRVQKWREESKGQMRLGIGLLLVALGWVIILVTNGVTSFG
jgi:hypothetical protein